MKLYKHRGFIRGLVSILVISQVVVQADEYTVESGKFEQAIHLEATAIPDDGEGIFIEPKEWSEFRVEKFLPQGSIVAKGDKLLWIDTADLDKKIEEVIKERAMQKIVLEKAELELSLFTTETADSLADAEQEYKRFQEDYDYYVNVEKPQKEFEVAYTVERAKNGLSYTQEELDQLLKMYEEDGLTEETEEIIIKRAKHGLKRAQKNLEKEERIANFERKVVIPRGDEDWEVSAVREKKKWEHAQKELPLALKVKELEVEKLRSDGAIVEQKLTDLKADRLLAEFNSPSAGVVYFGRFEDGKWDHEEAEKVFVTGGGGAYPVRKTLMTIVPVDSELKFNAFLTEEQKVQYGKNDVVSINLRLKSNAWKSISLVSDKLDTVPNFDHEWLVSFSAEKEFPEEVIIGSKADISVITFSADSILSIPVNAIKSEADGTYSVQLVMADGDPKVTPVELGRQAVEKIEVLSGLENGQVIVIP